MKTDALKLDISYPIGKYISRDSPFSQTRTENIPKIPTCDRFHHDIAPMLSKYPHTQRISWSNLPSEIRNQIYDNILLEQLSPPMVKQACNYLEGYYKRSGKTDYRYVGVVVNPSIFQKRTPKFPVPELLDEIKSCRRSRSSHRAVLSLASTCRQTRMELTPLFYQGAQFQIFEEGLAFGYYEDSPFAALRSFLQSIGPVNASSLRRVQVWHANVKCAYPAPSYLSLIHGLHNDCIVRLPSADFINKWQSERAMRLHSNR